jgi:putative methyltransferase (TIGR04325 family)
MPQFSGSQAKQVVKSLTPPAVLELGKELRRRVLGRARPWEYFSDQWAEVSSTDPPRGWDVTSIPTLHARHWREFTATVAGPHPLNVAPEHGVNSSVRTGPYGNDDVFMQHAIMTVAYALAHGGWGRQTLSVLDWGGGVGHYYVLFRALFPDLALDYSVRDVPSMVAEGRRLLPEVAFYDDDTQCMQRTYDFVLSNSSLQYARDWRAALVSLARVTDGRLFVGQIPTVHNTRSFVVIQRPYGHGYDTEYLGWCFRRSELLDAAQAAGLVLVREFLHGFKPAIHGAPEAPEYRGYLFRHAP